MGSRRGQLQAYRFVTRRIVGAMLSGDPETADLPMRRLGLATFAGVMVGAIVLGAVGAYAVIRPGGATTWKNGKAVIVEKETGTRYVYRSRTLYPVLNYASARLLLGSGSQTVQVSARSLGDTPRGAVLGIPGAPDALPPAGGLVGLPWNVCTGGAGVGSAVGVVVGTGVRGRPLGSDGLLTQTPDGEVYLVTDSRRHAVRAPDRTLSTLGWRSDQPVRVGPAFLDAVPAGPDLEPAALDGAGSRGPAVPGHDRARIGDVFQVAAADQYFVLTADGLALVTATDAKVRLEGQEPLGLTPGEFDQAPKRPAGPLVPTGYPRRVPSLLSVNPDSPPTLCVRYSGPSSGSSGLDVQVLDSPPVGLTAVRRAGPRPRSAEATADGVVVPAGRGALVRAVPAPGVTTGTVYLVTDQGLRHPVGSDADVAALGYGGVPLVPVPSTVLDLVPVGPALSAAAANTFVPVPVPGGRRRGAG